MSTGTGQISISINWKKVLFGFHRANPLEMADWYIQLLKCGKMKCIDCRIFNLTRWMKTQVYFTCIFVSSPVVFTIFLRLPRQLSFVILRALGLDTWLGGLLNYMSCLVGESTKCFGNGTDERNAKSTDGHQSFRFLVWENGMGNAMGMKD